jgi:hypothetical protein
VSRGAGAPLAAAAAVAVLAACAQLQPPAPVRERPAPPPAPPPQAAAPAVETDETRQVGELLGYYQRLTQLGPEDQKREFAAATQSFNRDRSGANRIRLALLYTLPGTGFQDDARAVQLLEPIVAGSGGALRHLATLVSAQTAERIKTQKRADQMKEQVDALRAIEKQLIDRGQEPQPRK